MADRLTDHNCIIIIIIVFVIILLVQLGKQIADLESEVDEKNAKLAELERELDNVDKEFENKQTVHNQVITALKNVSS